MAVPSKPYAVPIYSGKDRAFHRRRDRSKAGFDSGIGGADGDHGADSRMNILPIMSMRANGRL